MTREDDIWLGSVDLLRSMSSSHVEQICVVIFPTGFCSTSAFSTALKTVTVFGVTSNTTGARIRCVSSSILQVDGGINATTIGDAVAAGANVIVAGTYIFSSKDMQSTIGSMKAAFQQFRGI